MRLAHHEYHSRSPHECFVLLNKEEIRRHTCFWSLAGGIQGVVREPNSLSVSMTISLKQIGDGPRLTTPPNIFVETLIISTVSQSDHNVASQ